MAFHSHKLQNWSVFVWHSISSFQSSPRMDSTADVRVGCGVCGKKVAPGYLFRHHQRYHSKMAKKFPCNSCPKEYYSGARLEDHIKGKHQDLQPSLPSFVISVQKLLKQKVACMNTRPTCTEWPGSPCRVPCVRKPSKRSLLLWNTYQHFIGSLSATSVLKNWDRGGRWRSTRRENMSMSSQFKLLASPREKTQFSRTARSCICIFDGFTIIFLHLFYIYIYIWIYKQITLRHTLQQEDHFGENSPPPPSSQVC